MKPVKLYGAVENGGLRIETVRTCEKAVWEALIRHETWSNCMDMYFDPTKKELKDKGWSVVKLELREIKK